MTKHLFYVVLSLIPFFSFWAATLEPTVTGSFSVIDTGQAYSVGNACSTYGGGYDDVGVGTDVVVKSGEGTIVGVGKLEVGLAESAYECRFPFTLQVKDAEFYSFEVGDRGELSYSRADLEAMGWSVAFSLGN
jgi:hypothetical protein